MLDLCFASTIRECSIEDIFSFDVLKMAKNKVSGQGKPAKGNGKGKGQDKSDVGSKEEKQESGRDHKWNDKTDEIRVRHILW